MIAPLHPNKNMLTIMRLICLLIIGSLCVTACQNPNAGNVSATSDTVTATNNQTLPESFRTFYEKFHADSIYQVGHVNWPLQGIRSLPQNDTTTISKPGQWTPEEWRFQQLDVLRSSNDYNIEYQTLGQDVVIERIFTKMEGFGMERRFAKNIAGEWELIYYADMHAINK